MNINYLDIGKIVLYIQSMKLLKQDEFKKKRDEEVVRLRKGGMTYRAIGDALGISNEWVRKILNEQGVFYKKINKVDKR